MYCIYSGTYCTFELPTCHWPQLKLALTTHSGMMQHSWNLSWTAHKRVSLGLVLSSINHTLKCQWWSCWFLHLHCYIQSVSCFLHSPHVQKSAVHNGSSPSLCRVPPSPCCQSDPQVCSAGHQCWSGTGGKVQRELLRPWVGVQWGWPNLLNWCH